MAVRLSKKSGRMLSWEDTLKHYKDNVNETMQSLLKVLKELFPDQEDSKGTVIVNWLIRSKYRNHMQAVKKGEEGAKKGETEQEEK